jgi:pimeloyl-ACP methyl ester carboxylesterase
LDREFPASDYLPRVQCPVLVIQGKLDPFGGPAQWEVLRTHIPLAQRVLLADAGHLPHREQTEAVIDSVTRFLTPISEQGRTDRVS